MMRVKKILIGAICAMLVLQSTSFPVRAEVLTNEAQANGAEDDKDLRSKKWEKDPGIRIESTAKVPTFSIGKEKKLTIPLKSREQCEIQDVVVKIETNKDSTIYPFVNKSTSTSYDVGTMEANGTAEAKFKLTARDNAVTGNYDLKVTMSYIKDGKLVEMSDQITVSVKGVEATETPDPNETEEPSNGDDGTVGGSDYDGGGTTDYGDSSSSSSDDSDTENTKKTGTPRVIVDGFRTEPATIKAGDTFKLILNVRNTSKKTAVSNMEINLAASGSSNSSDSSDSDDSSTTTTASDVFMPVKGSNTLFVDSIGVDKVVEVPIDLTARADLTQKPYQLEVSMKYEDGASQQYESTSSISVPVKQEARFEISTPTVDPESIAVGEEGSITFSINNLGRTKLYNVRAVVKSDTISGGEVFLGNLESGGSKDAELTVMGEQETQDAGEVKIVVTYEDQEGKADTRDVKCTLFVAPAAEQVDGMLGVQEEEPAKGGVNLWAILGVVGAAIVVMGVVIVFLTKRKRKKEEDFVDEIFGSDTDK